MINKFINLIFLSFILFSITQVNSQDNTFFRKYNLYGMQGGLQLAVTSDGGFIATGQHEGNGGNGECDIYVYRVDLCGNIVWFKLYGTSSQEGGKSIKQTSDGGFIVSGLGPSNTSPRAFNMKLDANGNIDGLKDIQVTGCFILMKQRMEILYLLHKIVYFELIQLVMFYGGNL